MAVWHLTWRLHISDASSARARLASAMASSSSAASRDARCSAADACSALCASERAAGCTALNAAPPAPYAHAHISIVALASRKLHRVLLLEAGLLCSVLCYGRQHELRMAPRAAPC